MPCLEFKKSTKDLVVLDAPLLIEAKFHFFCDEIWVVYVDEKKAEKPTEKRDNINEKLADEIIASQCFFEYKKKNMPILLLIIVELGRIQKNRYV